MSTLMAILLEHPFPVAVICLVIAIGLLLREPNHLSTRAIWWDDDDAA